MKLLQALQAADPNYYCVVMRCCNNNDLDRYTVHNVDDWYMLVDDHCLDREDRTIVTIRTFDRFNLYITKILSIPNNWHPVTK